MVYKPGANNPADYMSRHPDPKQSQASHHLSRVDVYVNLVTSNAVPPAVTLHEVNDKTAADETLQRLVRVIEPKSGTRLEKMSVSTDRSNRSCQYQMA